MSDSDPAGEVSSALADGLLFDDTYYPPRQPRPVKRRPWRTDDGVDHPVTVRRVVDEDTPRE